MLCCPAWEMGHQHNVGCPKGAWTVQQSDFSLKLQVGAAIASIQMPLTSWAAISDDTRSGSHQQSVMGGILLK